ncbi:MAG: fibronectin type III-like domain-contianing protein, partial [Bacteroidaceae bacterium]
PSGKLTTTFPKSTGQVPIYYAQRRSGRPMHDGYIDIGNKPLYSFGYGLSYTTFTCSQVMLSDSILHKKGAVTVSLNVTNTGSRTGKEVIQLYVHDRISSVTQPDKRLIDFRKVELKAGEMKQVCFILSAQQLKLWNKNLKEVFEGGEFDIFVGNSLDNLSQQVLKLAD